MRILCSIAADVLRSQALGRSKQAVRESGHGIRRLLVRFSGEHRGIAAIELALVAPILALIIVAIVDFGLAYARQMTLANGVRAGVQYAMVRRPVQGDTGAIAQTVADNAGVSVGNVAVSWVCTCSDSGGAAPTCSVSDCGETDVNHSIRIAVTESYTMILSYPGMSNPINLGDQVLLRLN